MIDTETILKSIAVPVAAALIGSFVTTARNEALVTNKLDNLTVIVQESVKEVKTQRETLAALKEEHGILRYRVEEIERKKEK